MLHAGMAEWLLRNLCHQSQLQNGGENLGGLRVGSAYTELELSSTTLP